MKHLWFILFFIPGIPFSQNIQVHYELDSDRQYFVSTFEMFKPDDHGATYWFVDMEYNEPGNKTASLAYMEIARYFALPVTDAVQASLQYNDGLTSSFPLGQIWLAGVSRTIDLPGLPVTVDVLYRHPVSTDSHDLQLTAVWFKPLVHGALAFAGFVDVWTMDKTGADGKDWIVFSEPQLWWNLNEYAAIGGEIHVQYNFPVVNDVWDVYPTVGVKWEF